MEGIGYITKLDHLGHVISILSCCTHVNTLAYGTCGEFTGSPQFAPEEISARGDGILWVYTLAHGSQAQAGSSGQLHFDERQDRLTLTASLQAL